MPSILYVVLEDFSTLASPVFSADATAANRRHTPYLASLAARGVVFQNAYCQAPICNPSRTSFLTGRRPTSTRVWTNDDAFPQGLPTIVDFLRDGPRTADGAAAVACAGRGKIFHIACDKETYGFTNGEAYLDANASASNLADARLRTAIDASSNAVARRSLREALNATWWHAPDSWESGQPIGHGDVGRGIRKVLTRSHDQSKTAVALRMLALHAAQRTARFFLAVGLASTHVHGARICKPAASEAVGGRELPPHVALPPPRATERDTPLVTWPNWDVPRFDVGAKWAREAIGLYYACATHVDEQIGALLHGLDVLELRARTAVVVQGDHGFSLGRHGRWSKYNLYEDATRVPLLFSIPGQPPAVVTDIVESLDVMSTLLDLWGVPRVPPTADEVAAARAAGTAPPTRFRLRGAPTLIEGESLLPYVSTAAATAAAAMHRPATGPAASSSSSSTALATALRRNRIARSELREWTVLHRAADELLPGALPRRLVGDGWQLYVRTPRYAYVAYLKPAGVPNKKEMPFRVPHRLIDESLFDHQVMDLDCSGLPLIALDCASSADRRIPLGPSVRP